MKSIYQINDMNHDGKLVSHHEMLGLLVNLIAMWDATSTAHDHKLLLVTKSCKNEWNFVIT
jgi:hypothetical protein